MSSIRLPLIVVPFILAAVAVASPKDNQPIVGQSEKVYTLAAKNTKIQGLTVDDVSPAASRLFVLDGSGQVFLYRIPDRHKNNGDLELIDTITLPNDEHDKPLTGPRGLAYARENGHDVLYYMNWDDTAHSADYHNKVISQLWRYDLDSKTTNVIDLSRYTNRIGNRELIDLALDHGDILVCFDPAKYTDQNVRVQRGIIRIRWKAPYDANPEFVRHMPDSGIDVSRGIASMELEGARYVWATVGNRYIYCADGPTGRGLFWFDQPKSNGKRGSCWGMCFGDDALWVSENVAGPSRVHRVNVTKNLDAPLTGPRVLRYLIMKITTVPVEKGTPHAGKVTHNYSRPYSHRQMPNQGIWPKTEKIVDLSEAPNATLRPFTYDPAGDRSSRQYMRSVVYADAPAQRYSSRYNIALWTRPYRKFIYPHRVNKDTQALRGTNYLEDDPELYNLTDTETYEAFVKRIDAHIQKKYGIPADMDNPYWAARNTIEYIQDNYYYPCRETARPAAVDYSRKHYDANPGNLKIELTEQPYNKNQIIACSGTSVAVAGTMRHLGIPARWLGTGTPFGPYKWDKNHNGLLDEDEKAPCSNGHRYNNVWLGSHYGWMCFDGTPTRPEMYDFDQAPPIKTQWQYMERCASGTRKPNRIVFNVGSRLFRPLYRDFKYNERQAVNNACGGDQRYNLQSRFEKLDLWKGSGDSISVLNVCFIENVKLLGPKNKTTVTWDTKGAWQQDRSAKLNVTLQKVDPRTQRSRDVATLAKNIPYNKKSAIVDLSGYRGKNYRIIIRKQGDSETGGQSDTFTIP